MANPFLFCFFARTSLLDLLMKIVNFSQYDSLLNQFLAEMRDVSIQHDSLRFRRNIERIGEIMAMR